MEVARRRSTSGHRLVCAAPVYFAARKVVEGSSAAALRNSARLMRIEQDIGIDVVSGALGLIIFAVFPVAPPRFLPGFVGTVSQAERQHFLLYPGSWSNRFASLPSFHAGWTLVAAILLATSLPGNVMKVIAVLPGPLVALSVIVTGNHFVIDVIVGSLVSLAALTVVSRRTADGQVPSRERAQPALLHSAYRFRQ